MLTFLEWVKNILEWVKNINENDFRTGAKIGLYPDIMDALGQYCPAYGMPKAADLITYLYLKYGDKGPYTKDGYYYPTKVQVPGDGITPKYVNPAELHRKRRPTTTFTSAIGVVEHKTTLHKIFMEIN